MNFRVLNIPKHPPQPLMESGATGPTGHSVGMIATNAEPACATTPHPRKEERTARAKNHKARAALEAIVELGQVCEKGVEMKGFWKVWL